MHFDLGFKRIHLTIWDKDKALYWKYWPVAKKKKTSNTRILASLMFKITKRTKRENKKSFRCGQKFFVFLLLFSVLFLLLNTSGILTENIYTAESFLSVLWFHFDYRFGLGNLWQFSLIQMCPCQYCCCGFPKSYG